MHSVIAQKDINLLSLISSCCSGEATRLISKGLFPVKIELLKRPFRNLEEVNEIQVILKDFVENYLL